jgi:hypothetical protein
MRTCTRDTQRSAQVQLIHDITSKLSTATRRLNIVEAHMSSLINKPTKPLPTKKNTPPPKPATSGASFWRNTSEALSHENTTLTDRVTRMEEDNAHLRHMLACSTAARKELEQSLNETNKELAHLLSSSTLKPPAQARLNSVPASTQGRDAMYWHLTCRSLETQYIQRIAELEAKVKELTEAVSTKRRRT